MKFLMLHQIAVVTKFLVTNIARVRPFTGMNAHMNGNGIRVGKCFLAHIASKRSISGVRTLVTFQYCRRFQHFGTNVALQSLSLICVHRFVVCLQQFNCHKSFVALITSMRPFHNMHRPMSSQLLLVGETFVTNVTLMRWLGRTDMHLAPVYGSHTGRTKSFATLGARILSQRYARMPAKMALQLIVSGELCIALYALERSHCRMCHPDMIGQDHLALVGFVALRARK